MVIRCGRRLRRAGVSGACALVLSTPFNSGLPAVERRHSGGRYPLVSLRYEISDRTREKPCRLTNKVFRRPYRTPLEKDAMKLRYGIPKCQRTWSGLLVLGLVLLWLARYVGAAASASLLTFGVLIIAAGMSAFVAGMIAERRDCERQQEKSDDESQSRGLTNRLRSSLARGR